MKLKKIIPMLLVTMTLLASSSAAAFGSTETHKGTVTFTGNALKINGSLDRTSVFMAGDSDRQEWTLHSNKDSTYRISIVPEEQKSNPVWKDMNVSVTIDEETLYSGPVCDVPESVGEVKVDADAETDLAVTYKLSGTAITKDFKESKCGTRFTVEEDGTEYQAETTDKITSEPKTSDAAKILLWSGIAVLAAIGLGEMKRRNRHE